MFSYWIGLLAKKDLREHGDGNPGAYNLWQAAGYKLGLLGIFMDFLKAYLPLALMVESGWVRGIALVPVALAPILGHVFSPFLHFRGGKGIAVTFGVWGAVSRFEISVAYALILALLAFAVKLIRIRKEISTDVDGFMVVFGMLTLGLYLYIRQFSSAVLLLWLCNLLVLAYTNRKKMLALLNTKIQ